MGGAPTYQAHVHLQPQIHSFLWKSNLPAQIHKPEFEEGGHAHTCMQCGE